MTPSFSAFSGVARVSASHGGGPAMSALSPEPHRDPGSLPWVSRSAPRCSRPLPCGTQMEDSASTLMASWPVSSAWRPSSVSPSVLQPHPFHCRIGWQSQAGLLGAVAPAGHARGQVLPFCGDSERCSDSCYWWMVLVVHCTCSHWARLSKSRERCLNIC